MDHRLLALALRCHRVAGLHRDRLDDVPVADELLQEFLARAGLGFRLELGLGILLVLLVLGRGLRYRRRTRPSRATTAAIGKESCLRPHDSEKEKRRPDGTAAPPTVNCNSRSAEQRCIRDTPRDNGTTPLGGLHETSARTASSLPFWSSTMFASKSSRATTRALNRLTSSC